MPAPFHPNGIITLLTDFGVTDTYVAQMKGVMLGIDPALRFVDLSHAVPPQDVEAGSFLLEQSFHRFPEGTVHLAVVDPGVGSARAPVVVTAGGHVFVGPDNGLLEAAVRLAGPAQEVRRLDRVPAPVWGRSSTFHGRDLFAPAAALLASGRQAPAALGPLSKVLVGPSRGHRGPGAGAVMHVDHFGNLITNIPASRECTALEVAGRVVDVRVDHYAEASPGSLVFLCGSSGRFEVSVVGGSAAAELGVGAGAEVIVRRA
jgi:S-adenosylmethionine hydrolase